MANFNNTVKVTQTQYNTLKSGGTISGHSYDANGLYLVDQTQPINPNILYNSDFRINQRGKTKYTASGYTVDRWAISTNSISVTVTPSINGVAIQVPATDTYTGQVILVQRLEEELTKNLLGKTLTFSCYISTTNTDIGRVRFWMDDTAVATATLTSGFFSTTVQVPSSGSVFKVGFLNNASEIDHEIKWCKLELGTTATQYVHPIYEEELYRCQRYYIYIPKQYTWGLLTSSRKNYYISVNLPRPMRTEPSLDQVNYTPAWKGWLLQTAEISGTNHLSLQNVNNSNNAVTFASGTSTAVQNGSHNPIRLINVRTVATYDNSGTTVYDMNNSTACYEITNIALDAEI